MAKKLIYSLEKHALAATLACIGLVAAAIFKDFLLFRKLYLFTDIASDSINFFYPNYRMTSDYIRAYGLPQWSFSVGMGQCILPNSVGDVFNDILYLLGSARLVYGLIYLECLKIILSGVFFFLYLRCMSLSKFACIIGSLMYAFNGYMLACSAGWHLYSTECVVAAALLLAFEKYFSERKWFLLPLVFAYVAASQSVFLFTSGLLLTGYSTLRVLAQKRASAGKLAGLYARLFSLGALGSGLSSIFLVSNLSWILDSPRIAGSAGYFSALSSEDPFGLASPLEYISSLCRLFSNDLLGGGRSFKGWNNYMESPLLYSTLAALVLAPQVFLLAERRRKGFLTAAFALCLVPFIFPYYRHMFWLFSGDYYRSLSLFMIIIVIFFGAYAVDLIEKRGQANLPMAGASVLFLLLVLYIPLGPKNDLIDASLRFKIGGFLAVYGGVLCLARDRSSRNLWKPLLLLVLIAELVFMGSTALRQRDSITSEDWRGKTGFNDYSIEALKFIKENDKGFFRITKDYTSSPSSYASFNDAVAQDFYGSMSFSSFNQRHYIAFLDSVGALQAGHEHQTRWSIGLNKRPLLQTLTAFKYRLSKNPDPAAYAVAYEPIGRFGDVRVLRKRFFLPLGVTFDRMIPAAEFAQMSDVQKDLTLLQAFVPDAADLDSLKGFRRPALSDPVELRKEALEMTGFSQNKIAGKIKVGAQKVLFMAIPFDRGWRATVDGAPTKVMKVDNGLMGLLLERGEHTIEFDYTSVYLKQSLLASLICAALYFLLLFNRNAHKLLW